MTNRAEPVLDKIGYSVVEYGGFKWAVPPGIRYSPLIPNENEGGLRRHLMERSGGGLFVDIGANLGLWPVTMHDRYERIICIEPSKFCVEIIRKNLELNNIKNVEIIGKAAWSSPTTLKLYQTAGDNDFSGGMITTERNIEREPFYEVETITIDSLNVKPDVIKINTEGAEWEILKGSVETLKNSKAYVFVDMHLNTPPFEINRDEIKKFMSNLGYRLDWIYDRGKFMSREVYTNV